MTTMEFLRANGVRLLRADKTEANSLGYWETVENLDNVIGKKVWICDFRNNEKNVFGKPIRAISPRQVMVFDADNAKKHAHHDHGRRHAVYPVRPSDVFVPAEKHEAGGAGFRRILPSGVRKHGGALPRCDVGFYL